MDPAPSPCTLHLVSLHPSTSASRFLALLRSSSPAFDPLYVAQPHHIIHRPRKVSREALLSNRFDLLVILRSHASHDDDAEQEMHAFPYSDSQRALISAHLVLPLSMPEHSSLFLQSKPRNSFFAPVYELPKQWDDGELRPPDSAIVQDESIQQTDPACTQLSQSLAEWLRDFGSLKQGQGNVTMMTLAALGPEEEENFETFQNEVSHRLGYPRGERSTNFTISGDGFFESAEDRVLPTEKQPSRDSPQRWKTAEIARWPSIWFWAEMLSSQDHRDLEEKHGICDGILQDKCIVCMTDIC